MAKQVRCPGCGQTDSSKLWLRTRYDVEFKLDDVGGLDEKMLEEHALCLDWDNMSPAGCACGYEGMADNFLVDPTPEAAEAALMARVREILAREEAGDVSQASAFYELQKLVQTPRPPAREVWLPKPDDSGRYVYPDGSTIVPAGLPITNRWKAYWAPKPRVGGSPAKFSPTHRALLTDGETDKPYYFKSPEEAATALGEGGEGPAKHYPDGRPRG